MRRFVQFPHPGPEAGADRQAWLRADTPHRRKFVVAEATFRRSIEGLDEHGLVTAWVEWEAASESRALDGGSRSMPSWVHRPISPTESPATERIPQNTDPLVFGDRMLTTFCRQPSNPSLGRLERGSVLVFGSRVDGAFVGDTVLVVADTIEHDRESYPEQMRDQVSDLVFELTLKPMYAHRVNGPFTAMFGATPDDPIEGMFSFVPCLPAAGGVRGFARPDLGRVPGLNADNWRAIALNQDIAGDRIPSLWSLVAETTVASGLALATRLGVPAEDALRDLVPG